MAHKTQKNVSADSIGYCLRCKAGITYCGEPFSADISCPKCGAVNEFENSQQPTRLKYAS